MGWYQNLKLKEKFVFFLFIMIILSFVGYYGVSNIAKLKTNVDNMYSEVAVRNHTVLNALIDLSEMRILIRDLYMASTEDEKKAIVNNYLSTKANIERGINQYRAFDLTKSQKEYLHSFDLTWNHYNESFDKAISASLSNHNDELLKQIKGDLITQNEQIRKTLNDLVTTNFDEGKKIREDSYEFYLISRKIMVATIILIVLCTYIPQLKTRNIKETLRLIIGSFINQNK